MASSEGSSPSDWPEKYTKIREIDNLLRCSICYEFLSTAMLIPDCSHNYCSLCIRRFLVYKSQCPTCGTSATEPELKNNRVLDDIVISFVAFRSELMNLLKNQNLVNVTKEKKSPFNIQKEHPSLDISSSTQEPVMKTGIASIFSSKKKSAGGVHSSPLKDKLGSARKPTTKGYFHGTKKENKKPPTSIKHMFQTQPKEMERDDGSDSDLFIIEEDSDDDFINEDSAKMKNRVPSSHQKTAETIDDMDTGNLSSEDTAHQTAPSVELPMNSEGDSARADTTQHEQLQMNSPPTGTSEKVACPVCGVPVSSRYVNQHLDRCLSSSDKKESLRSSAPKRKTLPKLVYNLMSDKEIKKKLKEIGLSCQGNRQILIKRHHEYTLLYNSECDKLNPKTGAQIVKQMEKLDQVKGRLENSSRRTESVLAALNKNTSVDTVEKAQKEYAKQHKSQFDQLIEETRKRMRKKKSAGQNEKSQPSLTDPLVQTKESKEDIITCEDDVDSTDKPVNEDKLTEINFADVIRTGGNVESDEHFKQPTNVAVVSNVTVHPQPSSSKIEVPQSVYTDALISSNTDIATVTPSSGENQPPEEAPEADESIVTVQVRLHEQTNDVDMTLANSDDELFGNFDLGTPTKDEPHNEIQNSYDSETSPVIKGHVTSSFKVTKSLKSPNVSSSDVLVSPPDVSPVFGKSTPVLFERNFDLQFDSPSNQDSYPMPASHPQFKTPDSKCTTSRKCGEVNSSSKYVVTEHGTNYNQSELSREELDRSLVEASESEGEMESGEDLLSQISQHIEQFERIQDESKTRMDAVAGESPWLLKTTLLEREASQTIASQSDKTQNEGRKKTKSNRRKLIIDDSSDADSLGDLCEKLPLSPEPVPCRRSLRKRKTTDSSGSTEDLSQETRGPNKTSQVQQRKKKSRRTR